MKISYQIVKTNKGCGLQSTRKILAGALILAFEKNFVSHSTNKTLRISENRHQLCRDEGQAENFINHSCEPNAYIDFDQLELRALKTIGTGEEITYDYLTSDWDGEDVFICNCKTPSCRGLIRGFRYLDKAGRDQIKHLLSPFFQSKFHQS